MPLSHLQSQLLSEIHQGEDIADTIDKFISARENLGFSDTEGNTPLHLACMLRNEGMITLLLNDKIVGSKNALTYCNNLGLIPLHILCIKDSQHLMPASKQNKSTKSSSQALSRDDFYFANNNANESNTIILQEVKQEPMNNTATVNMIKMLLAKADYVSSLLSSEAAEPSKWRSDDGPHHFHKNTPLHFACEYFGDDPTVVGAVLGTSPGEIEVLLEHQNEREQTPLHIACMYAAMPVISLLFKAWVAAKQPNSVVQAGSEVSEQTSIIPFNSDQSVSTARKTDMSIARTFMQVNTASTFTILGAAMFTAFIGAPATVLFPPLGVPLLIGGITVLGGASAVGAANMFGGSAYLGMFLGQNLNLMQFIADSNKPDVLRDFCKEMPAELLIALYEHKRTGVLKVSDIVKERNLRDPQTYDLSVHEFNMLINHQTCFMQLLKYFTHKQSQVNGPKTQANVDARMNDFCKIVTILTQFFIENQGQSATEEALKAALDQYLKSVEGRKALENIRTTQSKWGSTDRYSGYREALVAIDIKTLIVRHNEFCLETFNKDISQEKPKSAFKIVVEKLRAAFEAGGYEYQAPLQENLNIEQSEQYSMQ